MNTAKATGKPSVFEHKNGGGSRAAHLDVEGSIRKAVEKRHKQINEVRLEWQCLRKILSPLSLAGEG
jgi:hypothetical protein